MAAIPTLEEEDAKRPTREREQLVGKRTGIVNRIKATVVRLGIRGFNPKLRKAPERLAALRTPEVSHPAQHNGRAQARDGASAVH
jgi:transposase